MPQAMNNSEAEAAVEKGYEKKTILDFMQSICRTTIISITNDSSKSHGYHLQIAWLRWTSSRRSIGLYPSKNGGCTQIIENSKIGMSRHLDSSTTTQMA